jgi:hypothetical protein
MNSSHKKSYSQDEFEENFKKIPWISADGVNFGSLPDLNYKPIAARDDMYSSDLIAVYDSEIGATLAYIIKDNPTGICFFTTVDKIILPFVTHYFLLTPPNNN